MPAETMLEGATTLWEALGRIPDPRSRRGLRYSLRSILAVCVCAVMAGRLTSAAIVRWGRGLNREQREMLDIHRWTTPREALLSTLLPRLDVEALERVLALWVGREVSESSLTCANLDGKEERGSHLAGERGVHLLALYCEAAKGVLAQQRAPRDADEIGGAAMLILRTPLKGLIVTGDAIFAQKELCRETTEKGGTTFSP